MICSGAGEDGKAVMTSISRISTFFPERRTAIATLAEVADIPAADRQLLTSFGIAEIRDGTGFSAAELAVGATRALLAGQAAGSGPRALIHISGRAPEALVASEATRVQHESGLFDAFSMGISDLGCATSSSALMVGRALLAANPSWPGLVIAHGVRPPGPHRFRRPVTVNGDGGMALLLSRSGPLRILDIELETNGRYWDIFKVDYVDRPYETWREECSDERAYSFSLAVESVKRFAAMNERLLRRNGRRIEDVDHFVMQNISVGAYRFYEQAFDISFAPVCAENLRRYGHLGPADIVVNLKAGLDSGEFAAGQLVLVMNNAPVAAWSSMLIEV